jgi:hypothetical protein
MGQIRHGSASTTHAIRYADVFYCAERGARRFFRKTGADGQPGLRKISLML